MPLPRSIPVKYSEDDAQFISIRPLVRQIFRPAELIDMIVSVAGKDPGRVAQILHSGTVVFNSYRYWWEGIEAEASEISAALATYPDTDPSRPFRPEDCTEAVLESGGSSPRHALRLLRADASRKRMFRRHSVWDVVIGLTTEHAPTYREYSYARRADVYLLPLDTSAVAGLARQAGEYAARALRPHLGILPKVVQVAFLCPRR